MGPTARKTVGHMLKKLRSRVHLGNRQRLLAYVSGEAGLPDTPLVYSNASENSSLRLFRSRAPLAGTTVA